MASKYLTQQKGRSTEATVTLVLSGLLEPEVGGGGAAKTRTSQLQTQGSALSEVWSIRKTRSKVTTGFGRKEKG